MARGYVKKGLRVQRGVPSLPNRISPGGDFDPVEVNFKLRKIACHAAGRLMFCGLCQDSLQECKRELCKVEQTEVVQ